MIEFQFFFIVVFLIFISSLVLFYLYKRGNKKNSIILPKDLKGESSSKYCERKEDDHRKFNNRKGY